MSKNKDSTAAAKSIEDSPYYVPFFFILMLIGFLVLFGDFLFSNKILYGSDTLAAGFHHRSMLVENFKETGRVLQWDPHELGGLPYVDAFHGDIFYPLSVLKFFIPLYYHLGLVLVIHIFLAGIFMFLTAREFGLSKTAALFAAASYMYAGYLVSLVASGHDGNIYVASLFPLVMLFLHRGFNTRPFLNFSILGLVLGVIILSPHPRLSYFTLWAVALYTLYKLIVLFKSERKVKTVIRPVILVIYSLVIAISLAAIQFYPGYVYTSKYSVRAEKEDNWAWATSWSLHEEDVMSQLIPEFSGYTSKISGENYYWGKNAFKDSTETVGIVPLFLAVIGLAFSRRKEAYFFGGLALFAFIYALGGTTPFFKIFYYLIPKVESLRAPAMIMFLFSFSISLLAGMGIQTVINWKLRDSFGPGKRFYFLLAAVPALMFVLAVLFNTLGRKMLDLWTFLFFKQAPVWVVQSQTTKLDIAILNLPAVQSGAILAFFFTALAALLIWYYLKRRGFTLLLAGLVLIPVIDGIRFNAQFVTVVDPDLYLKSNHVVDFLINQKGVYRTFNYGTPFPTTMLNQFGVETVDGYHGNLIANYNKLLTGGKSTKWNNPRFLNLVGTKYLLIPYGMEIENDYFGPLPLVKERTSKYLHIVRNNNAFERAFLVNKYKVIPVNDEIIEMVREGQDNLREIVYLEEFPSISISETDAASDSAWIIFHAYDSVLVGVECTANRILVLTENYYDSWHAYVDGSPAKLLRAYGTFRAVAIPAGAKEVLFKYKSKRYEIGKIVTSLTSIYLLSIFGVSFWRYRRNQT